MSAILKLTIGCCSSTVLSRSPCSQNSAATDKATWKTNPRPHIFSEATDDELYKEVKQQQVVIYDSVSHLALHLPRLGDGRQVACGHHHRPEIEFSEDHRNVKEQ